MAHSKMRWISTPTFLACVGGAHDREEGANGGGARLGGEYAPLRQRMRPTVCRMRPSTIVCAPPTGICAPQSAVCAPYASICAPPTCVCAPPPAFAPLSQPYTPGATPTIQRGSDVAATVNKVSPNLPCSRSTRR
jgi:hypothetical protein